jgi:dienelactone hydrolase
MGIKIPTLILAGIFRMKKATILILFIALLTACAPLAGEPTPMLEVENNSGGGGIETPQPSFSQFNPNSVEALRTRTYGKGELSVEYAWENQPEFTRYYITYPSDGLTIHGFVNIPVGKGPFPVIIALHGFIPAGEYKTRDYSTRYADVLAQNGYIVLHPNMRNFPPSDVVPRTSDNLTGYTVDVLNLLALMRKQAGQAGIFKNADLERLGIWGHSIGGGIALRVLSIVPEIKAALLYTAVSQRYSNAAAGYTVFDLAGSQSAFSLHHGDADKTVQPAWTKKLDQQLLDLGKKVEYFTYPGQPHTFFGQNDALLMRRMIDFFKANL